ncbi:PP2C family protein-serine/threonine phosphatase [Uliginosibacterium gangwonense]|uniref:PP2C family protein-serine/threonine phosphatase n=1 Tax=Uliginosibacterium gangwonense TaxID=392736 RepID=UPI000365A7BA|nr:protein phosphatase 2C domain-containing protein [Uliginosibacterium gangwonense]
MTLELQTEYLSCIGGRSRNEDACAFWYSEQAGCWVLSDGAGGHGSGDVASRLVVEAVIDSFRKNPVADEEQAAKLLQAAQDAVVGAKQANLNGDDMHATCVILLIDRLSDQAVWGHVGDSRLYLFRAGRLSYQTRDHSLVQNMIDAGYGAPEMIRSHPNRNLLTSAIGNIGDLEATVSGAPLTLMPGDTFLMCTDGWWEYVVEDRMAELLQKGAPLQSWLHDMAGLVSKDGESGLDNYTAIAVAMSPDAGRDYDATVLMRSMNL